MKCFKCGKEMDREDGGWEMQGVKVTVEITEPSEQTREGIDYRNAQLGKYSDKGGGCDVATCYECYIDSLFNNTLPISPKKVDIVFEKEN